MVQLLLVTTATRYATYFQWGLAGIITLLCLVAIPMILHYREVDYNMYWDVRLGIVFFGGICFAILSATRIIGLFPELDILFGLDFLSQTKANMCRAHLIISRGLGQPMFLFLFYFWLKNRYNLHQKRTLFPSKHRKTIFGLSFLAAFPLLFAHIFIVALAIYFNPDGSQASEIADSGVVPDLHPLFYQTYNDSGDFCVVPLISVVASSICFLVFFFMIWYVLHRLRQSALNLKNKKKFNSTIWVFALFLISEFLLNSGGLITTFALETPITNYVDILFFMYYLTVFLFVFYIFYNYILDPLWQLHPIATRALWKPEVGYTLGPDYSFKVYAKKNKVTTLLKKTFRIQTSSLDGEESSSELMALAPGTKFSSLGKAQNSSVVKSTNIEMNPIDPEAGLQSRKASANSSPSDPESSLNVVPSTPQVDIVATTKVASFHPVKTKSIKSKSSNTSEASESSLSNIYNPKSSKPKRKLKRIASAFPPQFQTKFSRIYSALDCGTVASMLYFGSEEFGKKGLGRRYIGDSIGLSPLFSDQEGQLLTLDNEDFFQMEDGEQSAKAPKSVTITPLEMSDPTSISSMKIHDSNHGSSSKKKKKTSKKSSKSSKTNDTNNSVEGAPFQPKSARKHKKSSKSSKNNKSSKQDSKKSTKNKTPAGPSLRSKMKTKPVVKLPGQTPSSKVLIFHGPDAKTVSGHFIPPPPPPDDDFEGFDDSD